MDTIKSIFLDEVEPIGPIHRRPDLAIQEFQAFIEKLQPPRPGLVPQSGDYEHPYRWIRLEQDKRKVIPGREFLGKYKMLTDLAPKGLEYFLEEYQRLPESLQANAIQLLNFVEGYAKLAIEGKNYPDYELDLLYKRAKRIVQTPPLRDWDEPWSKTLQNIVANPNSTRLDKVILIDGVIHREHDAGALLPWYYGLPPTLDFGEALGGILDELAGDEPRFEKSFIEIRKATRSGLVPKVVPIEREGKIFRGIRWVRPEEDLKTPTGVRIPPAWKDVWVTSKKDNPLQAFGKDSKGRTQYLYSKKHSEKAASKKFARAKVFAKTLPSIMKQVQKDLAKHDEAFVLYLIYKTGFRIGKEGETLAAKKAYGASTLLSEHVTVNGDEVNFNFVGKKGVQINKTVEDAILAEELNKRLRKKEGKIFDVEYTDILDYLRNISGKSFNIKDFRTWMGTSVALEKIKTMRAPASEKEFKQFRREVGQEVASELGNTYGVALSAYISPECFAVWEFKLAEKGIFVK